MKTKILVFLFFVIPFLGYSQFFSRKKIKELEIKEQGFNVSLKYNLLNTNKINVDGLEIAITLLDPLEVEGLFFDKISLDGRHEYSYYEQSKDFYFLSRKRKKRQKTDLEYLVEGIDYLSDNELIPIDAYDFFMTEILINYGDSTDQGMIKKEIEKNYFNPYCFDNRYLSVAKIEIVNPSDLPIEFENKFQIISNENILSPLSNAEIQLLNRNANLLNKYKVENLIRFNLNNKIIIPAGAKIVKYIACLPIDYNAERVSIVHHSNSQKVTWQIESNRTILDDTYVFYELYLYLKYSNSEYNESNFYYLDKKNVDAYIIDDFIYINKNHINSEIDLIVYGFEYDKLFYSINENLNLREYIDFSKRKRENVVLEFTHIKEIKKKIKSK